MDERLLKSISITGVDEKHLGALFPAGNTLSDVEIWTSRSKIVNEHISSLKQPLQLVAIVDPMFTPVWGIVDKPYAVYTSNETTQLVFQSVLNHSETTGILSRNGLLTKLGPAPGVYLLFYIEIIDAKPSVKCIILELNMTNLTSIISHEDSNRDPHFIDEQRKEDFMDRLFDQRVSTFNNLSAKRHAEAELQQQQMKMKQTRQEFRKIISSEVKKAMTGKPRANQTEVAEICYKAMSYRFKSLLEITDSDFEEIVKWLRVFLDVLAVQ